MPIEVALGLDVGTGSTKAGLVDADGRLLAVGRSPHVIDEPRPGWSETDPRVWLDAAGRAARSALAAAADRGHRVRVVTTGLSGQMHGVVVCDHDLEPLRPAVLWSDRRSEPDLAGLRGRLGSELAGRLANPVVAGMAGPTLSALQRLEPGVTGGGRVRVVLQPKDWVRAKLTGEVATEPSDASATLLWDLVEDRWSTEACEVFGVDPGWLPPVLPSGEAAGALSPTGTELLGLEGPAGDVAALAGVPVATGAADTAAALLGAGLSVGETQLSTGTGGQLARLVDRPVVDPTRRTHLFRAASPGCGGSRSAGSGWYAMAAIQNAGVAIDWALAVLGARWVEVDSIMGSVAAGAEGVTFLPYLTGERTPHLDANLTGGWVGLRPSTGRATLIRSVFEGVAFALRDGLDALRAAGHPVESALLAGGGSVAPWWRQLLADALALPLTPHDATDASVRGAGLLAWSASGNDVDPAATVTRSDPVEPSPAEAGRLAEARRRFLASAPPTEPGRPA